MTKFVAEVTVGKRDRLVTLRIPAGNTIAPSLNQVTVSFDGQTSQHHREPYLEHCPRVSPDAGHASPGD